jgi:hypothetical protein
MPLIIKGQDGDFTPAPPGLHQGVCVDVVDLGMVDGAYGPKRKLKLIWQLKGRNAKGERFQVRQSYTQSLHEKARLRHDLKTWRGRDFTPEEIKAFDVEKLIGANCQMQVEHRVSAKGRTYANPTAIVPIVKGTVKLEAEEYTREPWPTDTDTIEASIPQDDEGDSYPVDAGEDCPF